MEKEKMKNNYLALCLFCKDENSYLKEWIDYHIKIGVQYFFIYDNLSKIPIKNTLKDYIKKNIVTVEVFNDSLQGRQCRAYYKCIKDHGKKYKWIGFIDTDEFIVLSDKITLINFLTKYEKYAAIGIFWLCFGSNGKIEPQKSQIYSYTKRSAESFHANKHIKTILQPKYVKDVVSKDPHSFEYINEYYTVDENFNIINGPIGTNTTTKIQLNHYVLRSKKEFEEKITRGGGNSMENGRKTMNFFNTYDNVCNEITDTKILKYLENA